MGFFDNALNKVSNELLAKHTASVATLLVENEVIESAFLGAEGFIIFTNIRIIVTANSLFTKQKETAFLHYEKIVSYSYLFNTTSIFNVNGIMIRISGDSYDFKCTKEAAFEITKILALKILSHI